ncbi:MAG TPA: serine/threonine-protein kinase [Haloferula sp.]
MKSKDPVEIHRSIHLGNLLGEGGMGRVLDGFAPDLGQHLAVKQLRVGWMEDAEVRTRFEEEVSIMASIDHPGVLPVYGIGLDEDRQLFYAMKKVEGQTFGQILAHGSETASSVPQRRHLLGILLDVCETVAAAHDKGIVHRDLKPDNILVDRGQSVYVIDWGLAKRTGTAGGSSSPARTMPGKVMGTPGYMAPEQADGRSDRAGAEADVFALGAMLYEILTGRRPFAGGNERAEMLGAIHQDPLPPQRVNWLLPRDINAVCLKALNKDPSRRYPGAGALAEDLRAHLEGRPVTAIRPNVIERLHYAARRRPMRAAVVSSLVVALTLLGAFVASQRWIDHRLAEKSMERLASIDGELSELEVESAGYRARLSAPDLPENERADIVHQMKVNDSRWVLAQFEAYRVLSSVMELRFIRTDPGIRLLARQRLISAIEASIVRGNPALGEAVAATYLERAAEGTLATPLSQEDLDRLRDIAARAARASTSP